MLPFDIDAALLSRVQFGFTIGFHILFPTLTIGLSLFLVIVEALWLRSGNPAYAHLYRLWVKIFALAFAMGVVSGIVLSYEIGTNFSRFSEIAGPVIGSLLSVEVLTAFFVEAGFLGVMLFGWWRVGPRLHFLATCLVALGTINSSFWILAANSWMQTPAGAAMVDGRFVVQDWWAVIFTSSFPYRLAHMLLASFVTVSFVVAGVSAWHLLRREHLEVTRRGLSIGLLAAALLAPLQIVVGDLHGLQVQRDQPVKVAAMEALWRTTRGAPLLLFAWPDPEQEKNHLEIAVPKAASVILTQDRNGEVKGLNEAAPEDRPNVPIVFWSFRIMVGAGLAMLAVAALGLWLRIRGRMHESPLLHRLCVASMPLGFVAVLAGWTVAEVGRQPFTVHGLVRTSESVSPIAAGTVATSLALFVLVYGALFAMFLHFAYRLAKKGPDYTQPLPERLPRTPRAFAVPAE